MITTDALCTLIVLEMLMLTRAWALELVDFISNPGSSICGSFIF